MFGLLKKKFKDFSEKVFGKSQEKLNEKENLDSSKNLPVKEDTSLIKEDASLIKEDASLIKEDPSLAKEDASLIKEDASLVKEDASLGEESPDFKKTDLEIKKDVDFEKKAEVIKESQDLKEDSKIPFIQESKNLSVNKIDSGEKKISDKPDTKSQDFLDNDSSFKKLDPIKIKEKKQPSNISKDLKEEDKFFPEKKTPLEEKDSFLEKTDKDLSSKDIGDKKDLFSQEYKTLESKKKEDIKKGTFTKIKSIFSSKIKLSEKELSDFLDDFEISLLEADVSIESANSIIKDLKERLVNFSFSKSNLLEDIRLKIKESLKTQLDIDCNLENYIVKENKEDPLIILFIGPNGAGKTTTIAKFANLYKNKGQSVVLASSDTFRAGSIDQLEIHAKRIGVRNIKQNYGSDPAAVSFDAVSSAKANKNDVVLIDTAGRQDTNENLLKELLKIKRVVKPHITIYIAESQAGQAIVEQIEKFEKDIGITGVILTKIDTDPKGGVAISILNELKKPIFYIGTGQEYSDIEKFSPDYIIERIV
jgi:fused signal recognition particle receptor